MQTFLPELTFVESARALDNKRLGKQRVEVLQLLKALAGETKGWSSHPACKMWAGREQYLIDYGLLICIEWHDVRKFKDTCYDKLLVYLDVFPDGHNEPLWYNREFVQAHRSNLIRKDPDYYRPKWPGVPEGLPYIWPK